MKKSKIITIITLIITLLAGCGARDVDTKFTPHYANKHEVTYSEDSVNNFSFTEEIGTAAEFSEELQSETITEIEEGMFQYLVETYNLDWEFVPTKVVLLDFSRVGNGQYSSFAAMADPQYKTVYINILIIQDVFNIVYRLAHELIHCMIYYNEGQMDFVLENSEGNIIGYYVSEAYADIIAAEYLESIGEENPIDYFLNGSGYCYTVVALQVLEHSITGKEMYLRNDMESFYTELKDLSEQHIVDADTVDYAKIFLSQADMNLRTSQQIIYSDTTEEFQQLRKDFLYTLFGNFEIVLAVSDGLNAKEEEVVFEYINHVFELEGKNNDVQKELECLKNCLE